MDQVSSCLVEKAGRRRWKQPKSAPKLGSFASASGDDDQGSLTQRSSEITGRNEATGSGPEAGEAVADNGGLIGSSGRVGSNSNRSSSSSANNGNGRGSSSSNKSQAYSKIFLQYLPHSINLNYMTGKLGVGGSASKQQHHHQQQQQQLSSSSSKEDDQDDEIKKQFSATCDTANTIQSNSRASSTTRRSIASALSKFKISSVSKQPQQQQPAQVTFKRSSSSNRQQQEEARSSQEELFDSSEVQESTGEAKFSEKGPHKASELEPARELGHKIRRKGFLYLKKGSLALSSSNFVGQHQDSVASLSIAAARAHQEQSGSGGGGARVARRRDLNNNSLTNLLGSSCHQQQDADEHNQCLLDNDYNYQQDEQQEKMPSGSCGGSDKMVGGREAATQETNNQQGRVFEKNQQAPNQRYTRRRKGTLAPAGGDPKTQLILATGGCLLLLLAMCLILAAGAKLANGQPQQPQPFSSRSQQPGGPNGPGGSGGQGQQSGGGGNNGVGPRGPLPAPQPAAGSLVANINCNKIKGHVTLTPNLQGGTTVSTQISAGPPGEVYQWSVHQFPVKPGAAMCSCSPMILGTKLIDLSEMHGNLPSDQEFNVQSSLSLFGSDSPVGHSLLLRGMKTGMVACATFLPTSRKSNYRAKFHTPISGSVTIFQTAFGTSFIAHLMYSNGTRRHSMHRFDLVKSEDDMVTTSLLSGQQVGGPLSAGSSRAEALALEQREHEHELQQCRHYATGEPLFRNMSYQLSVSTENFGMRGRTAMVLPQIPFETFASVFVIVYSETDPQEPMACAPLKFVKPKTAAAKFQSVSVQGSVVFSQDSPYDVTVARINLNLPNSDGHSYGIDELPMIIRRKSDTRVCPNIREIIYNPHHVEPSSVPAEGEATSDQYAVGDLSGKYGSLTGKSSEKVQLNDYNLPLYGPISIVGRAMTIYSAEGVAIACSNVELTTPMTTAFATFDYGIQGQFIFRQPVNDCNGDTYVYIEVSKPVVGQQQTGSSAQDQARSLDHNWHIHSSPVDSGLDHLSTTDCAPAGAHFNPYNTSTSTIYSRDCTPFNVLRCELGDMSAKMFTIEIPPYRVKGGHEPDIGKFFGTDIDLPLCGPVSIVNRSVVVHTQDFGHQRLACSTVIEFKPRTSS